MKKLKKLLQKLFENIPSECFKWHKWVEPQKQIFAKILEAVLNHCKEMSKANISRLRSKISESKVATYEI